MEERVVGKCGSCGVRGATERDGKGSSRGVKERYAGEKSGSCGVRGDGELW